MRRRGFVGVLLLEGWWKLMNWKGGGVFIFVCGSGEIY